MILIKMKMEMEMRMKLDINKEIWMNLIKQNRAEERYSKQY